MDEQEIIKGCLRNDRNCQKKLYERFYSKMLVVCLRYAKNRDEAKDMLQEGMLKVFDNLKHFGNKGSFEGWIRRIITNCAIDHLRKNKHEYLIVNTVYASEVNHGQLDEEVTDDDIIFSLKPEDVMRAVQQLTPAYRTVFNLYVMEELSHKEIAEMLDISEGTSKSNLAKAKFNLRKNLAHLIKKVPK
ncbi:MAG: RNA polymerase sigma factor [Bacteroidota bacterium]